MIYDLKNFQMQMDNLINKVIPEHHLSVQKRIVVRLHELIVHRNSRMPNHPVLWGWARRNWGQHVGVSCPTNKNNEYKPGVITTEVQDAMKALEGVKPFQVIWEYNNTPYIEKLENGHSQQAPVGMVAGALSDLQTFINEI